MDIYKIKTSNFKKFLYIIYVVTLLILIACNNKIELNSSTNESSGNENNHIISTKDCEDNPSYSFDYSVLGLPLNIPNEWTGKYIVDETNAIYFNGENEYPETSVFICNFLIMLDAVTQQTLQFMDIVTIPKDEITSYLNWGMNNGQFFLGYNDDYYYFSSGSFGITEQQNSSDELVIFNSEKVEAILKDSFNQSNINIYWKNPFYDISTLHGRNDKLPFEMNINFLYDIQGNYEYIDQSGELMIDEIINRLLQEFSKDLYIPNKNRRFTINNCDVITGNIYTIENMKLLADNINLMDYYKNGELDVYLRENCWIVASSCRVYDFQGFLPSISSREFNDLNIEYFDVDAGIWIIERTGNNYNMYRPNILYHGQDS